MKECVFMLSGQVVPKKNSRQLFYRNGRMINIPSKRYQEWHDNCLDQLDVFRIPKLNPPYRITYSFWMKDKRTKDLDNLISSCNDLLKDAGIIQDDDSKLLTEIHAYYKGVSKESPRVKIDIIAE